MNKVKMVFAVDPSILIDAADISRLKGMIEIIGLNHLYSIKFDKFKQLPANNSGHDLRLL